MPAKSSGTDRAQATRGLILAAAERLIVEHGIAAVSNRQIGEAAGQANSAAVWYHFGSKADLVRAIAHRHGERIEQQRVQMVERLDGSAELADWVACLVRPLIEHLAELGTPSWYARFVEMVMADPALRTILQEEGLSRAVQDTIKAGLDRCRADLPADVVVDRQDMARLLIVHMCAERERTFAEGVAAGPAWDAVATGLIDAIVAIWLAPVTAADDTRPRDAAGEENLP